jgi:hypothetical protein
MIHINAFSHVKKQRPKKILFSVFLYVLIVHQHSLIFVGKEKAVVKAASSNIILFN